MGGTNVAKAGDARQITSTTWAAKTPIKGWYEITDVGNKGSIWYYDGTNWLAQGNPILCRKNKGWLLPSLASANAATYSQSGTTITVQSTSHGIPNTQNGKDVYLVIGSGAATTGWFTNFTYVDANNFTCTSAVSQTTSGAVNTNTSKITITELTTAVLGGLLGLNGTLLAESDTIYTSSANTKTIEYTFGSFVISATPTTTNSNGVLMKLKNRNSQSLQTCNPLIAGPYGAQTTASRYGTVDTSANQNFSVALQLAAANEFVALEHLRLILMPD